MESLPSCVINYCLYDNLKNFEDRKNLSKISKKYKKIFVSYRKKDNEMEILLKNRKIWNKFKYSFGKEIHEKVDNYFAQKLIDFKEKKLLRFLPNKNKSLIIDCNNNIDFVKKVFQLTNVNNVILKFSNNEQKDLEFSKFFVENKIIINWKETILQTSDIVLMYFYINNYFFETFFLNIYNKNQINFLSSILQKNIRYVLNGKSLFYSKKDYESFSEKKIKELEEGKINDYNISYIEQAVLEQNLKVVENLTKKTTNICQNLVFSIFDQKLEFLEKLINLILKFNLDFDVKHINKEIFRFLWKKMNKTDNLIPSAQCYLLSSEFSNLLNKYTKNC